MSKAGFAKTELRSFIDRVEKLEDEKAALAADVKEVYSEARGSGFDVKIMRQVVALRKLDRADFQEREAILDLYLTAMDMRDAPLLDYANRDEPAPRSSVVTEARQEKSASPRETGAGEVSSVASTPARNDAIARNDAPPISDIPAFLDRRVKPPPEPALN